MRRDRSSDRSARPSRLRTVGLVVAVALAAPLLAVGTPVAAAPARRSAERRDTVTATSAALPTASGTIPTLPKSSAFVSRLYSDMLGRSAREADVAYWGARIDARGSTVPAVNAIVASNEVLGREVRGVYAWLGRPPTSAQLAAWIGRLRGGLTYEALAATFIASPEFAAKWSGTGTSRADSTAHGMYEVLLGTAGDAAGRAHWAAQIHRVGTAAAATAFERTTSVATRSIDAAFMLALGRRPNASEAVYWRSQFTSGRSGHDGLVRELLDSPERSAYGCDPLGGNQCLLPFPDDYLTVADPDTLTGRRVALTPEIDPTNAAGTAVDPRPTNRSDGFSPGDAALLFVPGISLTKTGAVPDTNIGAYAAPNAPIAVIDTATGQRQPIWTELDSSAPAGQQVLYIRPAKDWAAGHRYIVVLRNLKDGHGATIPAPSTFAAYRDGGSADVDGFAARKPHMEQLFQTLAAAGFARHSLYLAWDFTVASTANTTGRMLHIRDDAFARLGTNAPTFHVTSVQSNPRTGIAREVRGTYEVPSYLTQDGPGGRFLEGADGLPEYAGHDLTTTFTCMIPTSAMTTPGRGVVYGHGLFGDQDEVQGQLMPTLYDMDYCATNWLGMAGNDVGTAFQILNDVSLFPELADRTQEGVLATLFLGKLLESPKGFVTNAAFQNAAHHPVIATGDVFYDGNSQGGILGGITTAVSTVWTRAVLGVTGMDFSVLVQRSTDFAPFNAVLKSSYPSAVERAIGLDILQMQWDRSEPDGYAAHLTSDPLPGTPAHTVLMDVAVGDHQVSTLAADDEARTAGIEAHIPAVRAGRTHDVTPLWGITAIPSYPFDGSAYFYWDSGSPLAPTTNTPPTTGHDPHEDPRQALTAAQQKNAFLQTGGTVIDPCNGQPCVIPQT